MILRDELPPPIKGGHSTPHYVFKRKIGSGSFGEIYEGVSTGKGEKLAIKLELPQIQPPQLPHEYRILRELSGAPGFPQFHWFGTENFNNLLVMELLGESIDDIFNRVGPFSLKTVLMLADQMISRIEYFHQKNYLHRDIKTENFVMGLGPKSNTLHLIDFGLSKVYCDPVTKVHIPFRANRSLIGTIRYASINANSGFEQSRRDDLESIAYLLIYLLKGRLPWQGINAKTAKRRFEKIIDIKKNYPKEKLCSRLPQEFSMFLESVRKLEFDQKPNYEEYKMMFRNRLIAESYIYDYRYYWINEEELEEVRRMKASLSKKTISKSDSNVNADKYNIPQAPNPNKIIVRPNVTNPNQQSLFGKPRSNSPFFLRNNMNILKF